MDRNEAVLRELNLYPQWVRREQPAPDVAEDEGRGTARRAHAGMEASSATTENRAASAVDVQPSAMGIAQPVLSADEGLNPSYATADDGRGTARRADADAGVEASCVPSENRATSDADAQPSAMGIAPPVLSADEGLNPSYESAPAEGRLGGGVADIQQSVPVNELPVQSADEWRNASDLPVEIVAEPAVAVASAEPNREQFIARLGWPELKTMVRDCTACRLRAGCTQTVFGVGDQQADWLFVGEGPGADEDARGEPFVGEAGRLLDNMLLALKLKRGDNVYIANVVKCRPSTDEAGKQLPPKADEIATCLPYLRRQIQLIQPKVIVALGKTAATALLQTGDVALGSLRETVHDFDDIPLIVTYHPAYLLRSPMEKARAWQDLCLAQQMMQENS